MTQPTRALPYPEIWLEPVCADCVSTAEVTWCQDNVYDPCPNCGRKPLRYIVDRRQARSRLPKGATP